MSRCQWWQNLELFPELPQNGNALRKSLCDVYDWWEKYRDSDSTDAVLVWTYPIDISGRHLENVVSNRELLSDGLYVVLLDEPWGVGVAHHFNLYVLRGCTTRVGRVVRRHSQLQAVHIYYYIDVQSSIHISLQSSIHIVVQSNVHIGIQSSVCIGIQSSVCIGIQSVLTSDMSRLLCLYPYLWPQIPTYITMCITLIKIKTNDYIWK